MQLQRGLVASWQSFPSSKYPTVQFNAFGQLLPLDGYVAICQDNLQRVEIHKQPNKNENNENVSEFSFFKAICSWFPKKRNLKQQKATHLIIIDTNVIIITIGNNRWWY